MCRRDEPYWPEAKRLALEDRYHSDFGRQDRFHDFDHRDRGRYQDHCLDRWEGTASSSCALREILGSFCGLNGVSRVKEIALVRFPCLISHMLAVLCFRGLGTYQKEAA